MNKTQLQERWSEHDIKSVASALRHGGEVVESLSPFGRHMGRIDLRGFRMPAPVRIDVTKFVDVDFSGAELSPLWLEHCQLENVLFDLAKLDGCSDQGNRFERCRFSGTSMVNVGLGYQGSQYHDCVFEKCNFLNANGIRAEFYRCRFKDCKLKGVDFGASAFEDCAFEGKLADVWFRGGHPYPEYERKFGTPKKNHMKGVSFGKAELEFVDFSHDCDLSTVALPEQGEYRKYDHWPKRLLRLKCDADTWDSDSRKEGLFFVQVMLPHAQTQEWMIINLADVRKNIAPHATERIIESLDKPICWDGKGEDGKGDK